MTWRSAKSFVEKVGEKLVRDNVLVSSIAELVERGSLNDEEAAFLLVKILAADAEHSRKQLIAVALRVPPSMSFPLPASGETGTAHLMPGLTPIKPGAVAGSSVLCGGRYVTIRDGDVTCGLPWGHAGACEHRPRRATS